MKQFPVMTAVMAALIVIAAAVGGAVVIWGQPGALSFQEYLDDLKVFALAVAGLGGARGLIAAAQHLAEAIKPVAAPAAPPAFTQTSGGVSVSGGTVTTGPPGIFPFWTATGNPASTPVAYSAKKPPVKKPAAKKPAVKKPPPRGK